MHSLFTGSVAKDGCRTGSISPLLGCGESGESIDDLYTLSGFFTLIIGNRSIDMPAQVVGRYGNSFLDHWFRIRTEDGSCQACVRTFVVRLATRCSALLGPGTGIAQNSKRQKVYPSREGLTNGARLGQ